MILDIDRPWSDYAIEMFRVSCLALPFFTSGKAIAVSPICLKCVDSQHAHHVTEKLDRGWTILEFPTKKGLAQ